MVESRFYKIKKDWRKWIQASNCICCICNKATKSAPEAAASIGSILNDVKLHGSLVLCWCNLFQWLVSWPLVPRSEAPALLLYQLCPSFTCPPPTFMPRLLQTKPEKRQRLITVTTIHETILATWASEAISVIKTKEEKTTTFSRIVTLFRIVWGKNCKYRSWIFASFWNQGSLNSYFFIFRWWKKLRCFYVSVK